MNVKTATTAELVAFYNEKSGKPVIKKFQDRATAEKRVQALLDTLAVEADSMESDELIRKYGFAHCPKCDCHLSNGVIHDGDECNGKIIRLSHEFECMACGHGFGKRTRVGQGSGDPKRAAAIAATWVDGDVRAARVTRNAVTFVDDSGSRYFKSVRAAFIALGLPMSRHIKFRGELKKAGELEGFGGKWKVV